MNFFGDNAQQQRIKTRDHQALNVVGIAVIQRLRNGVSQASHFCVTRPVKRGQLC